MSFAEMVGRWGRRVACFALFSIASAGAASAQNVSTNTLVILTAQGAGTVVSSDLPSVAYHGVIVGVNLTAVTTATLVVHIQGKDQVAGTYYDILPSQNLTTTGYTALTIYPGVLSTGTSYPGLLPGTWRVTAVVTGGAAAVTGTIDATMIQ